MKKLIILLSIAFTYTATTAQEQRFIEVVAEETMDVAPDEFTFSFRLREKTKYVEATTMAIEEMVVESDAVEEATEEATEEVAEAVDEGDMGLTPSRKRREYKPKKRIVITIAEQEASIRAFLEKSGINPENLTSFSNNEYYGSSNRKEFLLKIDKPEKLSEIMHALDTMGASRQRMVSFKNKSINKYKGEMAVKALKNAEYQAKQLVGVYGEKLGKVISISESFGEGNANMDKLLEMVYIELLRKNHQESYTATITYKVKVKFAIK